MFEPRFVSYGPEFWILDKVKSSLSICQKGSGVIRQVASVSPCKLHKEWSWYAAACHHYAILSINQSICLYVCLSVKWGERGDTTGGSGQPMVNIPLKWFVVRNGLSSRRDFQNSLCLTVCMSVCQNINL